MLSPPAGIPLEDAYKMILEDAGLEVEINGDHLIIRDPVTGRKKDTTGPIDAEHFVQNLIKTEDTYYTHTDRRMILDLCAILKRERGII